jgi:group I intron endonuclease
MQIYQVKNKITNKSYIGKSKNYLERFKVHIKNANLKINRRLYDSINCHGVEHFELVLVEDLGEVSRQVANEREAYWIKELNTVIPNGYNMTGGGDGGNTLEDWDDERKKMLWETQAERRTGSKRSEEQKKRMSISATRREAEKTTEEKARISAALSKINKERGISPPDWTKWKKGQVGAFTGKKHTSDAKKKLSEARLGLTYTDIFGEVGAQVEREKRRLRWMGSNNPNSVDYSEDKKLKTLEIVTLDNNVKMNTIAEIVGVSPYKIREFFKSIGIYNFQKFKRLNKELRSKILNGRK